MNELNVLLSKCQAGLLGGSIENCIVVAHDNGYIATATNAVEELAALRYRIAELEADQSFHPRAMKLIRKKKNFLVVAEDEPYFMDVYAEICDAERSKGRWTEIDEQNYQDALIRRSQLPKPPEEK